MCVGEYCTEWVWAADEMRKTFNWRYRPMDSKFWGEMAGSRQVDKSLKRN